MTIGSPDGSILRLNYWLVVESLFLNDYKKYDRYKKKTTISSSLSKL